MSFEDSEDIQEINDLTFKEILNNLLDKDNLELKTHIFKPKQLATLKVFGEMMSSYKYPKSAKIIKDFLDIYLTYMVSFNRESRKEIIKALTHLIEDEHQKQTGNRYVDNLASG